MPRILAVDDNSDMLELIGRAVRGAGHPLVAVNTGAKFMVAYSKQKPDVVILDVVMPDVDGIELLRWLADVGCTARIIIISGDIAGRYGPLAQKLGEAVNRQAVTYLPKPFRIVDLLAAIEGTA